MQAQLIGDITSCKMCSIAAREHLKYMCCRCCSKTQQKIWVFGTATVFLVLGLVGIICGPSLIMDMIYKMLPLKEGGRTYDKWANTPVPIYMAMYLYNWTNTEDVRVKGVKPNFERVGPYVFREERIKQNITWYPNNTVSFMPQRFWYFEPDMSGGTLEDKITCPHLPTIAASNIARDFPKVIKVFFNIALNSNGGALYQTHTADEWLFKGFYDEFLDYAMKLNNSMTGDIKDNHFAWFLHRNGSADFEGIFTINTGAEDLREMGELKLWNGVNHTGYFKDECGRVNGSTSDLFVPNRKPDEWITIFMKDTCRIINLVPSGRTTIEGIEGIRYETKPDTYDSGTLNPDMKCYCPRELMPNNCPKHGATDIRSCADGAPMFMSHPGFLYADPSYANTTTGTKADPEKDVFFITMEPKLGVPLDVNVAIQISLYIQPDRDISLLRGIPSFYAPLFTINSIAKITPDIAKEVKLALNIPNIGLYTGIGITCLAVLIASVGIFVTVTKRWYEPIGDENTIINNH